MLNQYQALIKNSPSDLTLFSNTAAFLMEQFTDCNWIGFYFVDKDRLVLGPFQGKVACETIPFGKGVCGYVWQTQTPIIVKDVHLFEGHIACDEASLSEMVIPLFFKNEFIGVLDMDAPIRNRFDETDLELLSQLVTLLQKALKKGNLLP